MRQNVLLIVFCALILSGCATVSQKVETVPAPVAVAEQAKAQQQMATPEQKTYKRKIAIGRFTNETTYGRSLLTDAEFDRIGKQASDMLGSRLIKSGKFLIFERQDLTKVLREQNLVADHNLVGVDVLILGSVTEFGRSVGGKVGFLSSTKVQIARAKVDIRLVDVPTGYAFFSSVGAGEASTESGEIAGYGSWSNYDATLNDRAIAAAITDVVDKLVSSLEERPWRTDILQMKDNQVFISGGSKQGLRINDLLKVMKSGQKVTSRQSGFQVALPPTEIATLRVTNFFGESEVEEGSVCSLVSGHIDESLIDALYVTGTK
jgi:curli biogenesis system outer membrane secretion channel CsgG